MSEVSFRWLKLKLGEVSCPALDFKDLLSQVFVGLCMWRGLARPTNPSLLLTGPRPARPALPGPRRRIAVIGSGISGLGTAWLLDPHHDVTLFEAEPRAGGHTRTVEAMGARVDTGFIVCNRRTYPLFVPLLEHLGVALEPSDMTF